MRLLLPLLLLAALGCTSSIVSLEYQPDWSSRPETPIPGTFRTGPFADARSGELDRIGVVRGGYGNPLVTLKTAIPVQDVVEEAFSAGLRAHGMELEGEEPDFEVSGRILRLDSNQYQKREAHVHVDVRVVHLASGDEVSLEIREDAVAAGGDGTGEMLRSLAEDTLRRAVDRVVFHPELAEFARARLR